MFVKKSYQYHFPNFLLLLRLIILVWYCEFITKAYSFQCEAGARQKPLYLTKSLALLAGDVINFKANGVPGWIGPSETGDVSNVCAEIPLSIQASNITDTQFIVVPVAVLDESTIEQMVENPDGSQVDEPHSIPRLVSTIQLIHVGTGRLLGTQKSSGIISGKNSAPLLLPAQFGNGCSATVEKYNSIWDLDVHDLDTETLPNPGNPDIPGIPSFPGPGGAFPPPQVPNLNSMFPAMPGTGSAGSVSTTTPTNGFKVNQYASQNSQNSHSQIRNVGINHGVDLNKPTHKYSTMVSSAPSKQSPKPLNSNPQKTKNQANTSKMNTTNINSHTNYRSVPVISPIWPDPTGNLVKSSAKHDDPLERLRKLDQYTAQLSNQEDVSSNSNTCFRDNNPLIGGVDDFHGEFRSSDPIVDSHNHNFDVDGELSSRSLNHENHIHASEGSTLMGTLAFKDKEDEEYQSLVSELSILSQLTDLSELSDHPNLPHLSDLSGLSEELSRFRNLQKYTTMQFPDPVAPGIDTLFSSAFSKNLPPKPGIENTLTGNEGTGLKAAESIESAAAAAAAQATSGLLNTAPTDVFTNMDEDSVNAQQLSFMQQHLASLQAQQLSSNSNLTSVAHGSILGLQSAMISLRIRELGSGPVELVAPCNGYLSQMDVNISPDRIIKKPISIFSSKNAKQGVRKVLNERGEVEYSSSQVLWGSYSGTSPKATLSYSSEIAQKLDKEGREWDEWKRLQKFNANKKTMSYNDDDDDDDDDDEDDDDDDDEDDEDMATDKNIRLRHHNDNDDDYDQDTNSNAFITFFKSLFTNTKNTASFFGSRKATTFQYNDGMGPDKLPKRRMKNSTTLLNNNSENGRNRNEKKSLNTKTNLQNKEKIASWLDSRYWVKQYTQGYKTERFDWNRQNQQKLKNAENSRLMESKSGKIDINSSNTDSNASVFSSYKDQNPRFSTFSSSSPQSMSSKSSKSRQMSSPSSSSSSSSSPSHSPSGTPSHPNSRGSKSTKKTPFSIPKHRAGSIPRTGERHLDDFIHKLEHNVKTTSVKMSKSYNTFSSSSLSSSSSPTTKKRMKTMLFDNFGDRSDGQSGVEPGKSSTCTLRTVVRENGSQAVECVPTVSSCPTSTAIGSNTLWAITRVPFNDVPTSSLFLAESMSNLNYDMDYATINTYPFMIGQMGLRNFSPFEQFLTTKCSKVVTNAVAFRWLVGITPSVSIAFGDLPAQVFGGISSILNGLLAPLIGFLESIIPGIGGLIPDISLPSIALGTIGFEIPIAWSGAVTHSESQEIVVSYSVTAPPQAHVLGRAIAHMGKSSVPFTLDVTRRVHVPAGIYGQTTGQLIAYDYRVPGVYEGAKLINTEFLIDTI